MSLQETDLEHSLQINSEIQPNNNRSNLIVRIFASVSVFLFSLLNSLTSFAVNNEGNVSCIKDSFITATESYNNILKSDEEFKIAKILLMINFALLDSIFIFCAIHWIIKGKNWRPVLNIAFFLLLKVICSLIFKIKALDNKIWIDPGFPSLLNTYVNDGDYFFSGCIGIYVICILELFVQGYKKLTTVTLIAMFFSIVLLLSLRVHYFISLACGIFAAHYFHFVSNECLKYCNFLYSFDQKNKKGLEEVLTSESQRFLVENIN
jgi:hypothetical protein